VFTQVPQKLSQIVKPRRLELDPRTVRVQFVADKLALGQFSLKTHRFSTITIVLPWLLIHFHLQLTLYSLRTDGVVNEPQNKSLHDVSALDSTFFFRRVVE